MNDIGYVNINLGFLQKIYKKRYDEIFYIFFRLRK